MREYVVEVMTFTGKLEIYWLTVCNDNGVAKCNFVIFYGKLLWF